MFITKIIKSKKISCLLKLNITASTLYHTQAMDTESENESKSYSHTDGSENGEYEFSENKNDEKEIN